MSVVLFAVLLGYNFGSGSDTSAKSDEFLKKTVLAEYPKALKELEDFYGKARGLAELREENLHDPKKPIVKTRAYTFVSNRPEMARVSSESTVSLSGHQQTSQRVICYNKDYSFVLTKENGANDFSIRSLDKGKAAVSREMQQKLSLYLDAPFQLFIHPLRWIVEQPKFRVLSLARILRDGKPMISIEFDCPIDNNRQGGYAGKIIVSPNEKWALCQYEYKFKKGKGFRTGSVEYKGTFRGFPIPRHVVHATLELPERRPVSVAAFEFKDLHFDALSEKEFTLTAFGLPELLRVGNARRTSNAASWLIVAALIALAIAVVFKVAASRLRQPGLE
jgi:hypothetical protein